MLVLASPVLCGESESWGNPEVCTVLIVYEDLPTRERAVSLCDALVRKFTPELDFEFTWWRFKFLSDAHIAHQAAQAALQADLILVSIHRAEDLPLEIKAWFERWLSDRHPSEGALVVLHTSQDMTCADPYLRLVALRANLDYLPLTETQLNGKEANPFRETLNMPAIVQSERMVAPENNHTGWGIND